MRTFPQLFRDVAGHKRSVELNLRTPEGRARALELVAGADVFCEGWRPGVAARLGVGYDDVRAGNPSIIYCSVSGYGQTGPNVERPGHDVNYQALAGALAPRPGEDARDPARADRRSRGRDGRRVLHLRGVGEEAADRRRRAHRRRDGRRRRVVVGDQLRERAARPHAARRRFGGLRRVRVRRRRLDHARGHLRGPLLAGGVRRRSTSRADLRGLGHLERLDRFDECQAAVARPRSRT